MVVTTLDCPVELDSFLSKSSDQFFEGTSSDQFFSLGEQHFEITESIVEIVFKLFVVTFAYSFQGICYALLCKMFLSSHARLFSQRCSTSPGIT